MEPTIVEKDEMILAGVEFYGDPFKDAEGWSKENEIGKLWSRFEALWEREGASIKTVIDPGVGYEVHIEPPDCKDTKRLYVMVGAHVGGIEGLPVEMCARVLPAGTYATFTLRGEQIRSDWANAIFEDWLPASGYEEAHAFLMETYDAERFKGTDDPESELDVYVPVRKMAE